MGHHLRSFSECFQPLCVCVSSYLGYQSCDKQETTWFPSETVLSAFWEKRVLCGRWAVAFLCRQFKVRRQGQKSGSKVKVSKIRVTFQKRRSEVKVDKVSVIGLGHKSR